MTTITDAHRAEAEQRADSCYLRRDYIEALAQALAEPAFAPVDPDLIEARECAALAYETLKCFRAAEKARQGMDDKDTVLQSALIAIKRSKPNG